MMKKVDISVVVQKPDGTYDLSLMAGSKPIKAEGIGPEGWNKAMLHLIPKLLSQSQVDN
jgi:hypothetical protein